MISKDDVQMVLAYFNLKSAREYCLHEVAFRQVVRTRFLQLARQLLGDVPTADIIKRLRSMGNTCARK